MVRFFGGLAFEGFFQGRKIQRARGEIRVPFESLVKRAAGGKTLFLGFENTVSTRRDGCFMDNFFAGDFQKGGRTGSPLFSK